MKIRGLCFVDELLKLKPLPVSSSGTDSKQSKLSLILLWSAFIPHERIGSDILTRSLVLEYRRIAFKGWRDGIGFCIFGEALGFSINIYMNYIN